METAEIYEKTPKNKRPKKKRSLYDYVERLEEAYRNNKVKTLIDFDEEYLSSIKSFISSKKKTKINLTT